MKDWNELTIAKNGKTPVHLGIDKDVLDWFKARGNGHLTRISAVLRAYVDAQRNRV